MNKAYLLTGTNLGNREENLKKATDLLKERCGSIGKISPIYETAPWGNINQPSFLNQAIELNTSLNAEQLMFCILEIEKLIGRVRTEKNGPRIIDIDILLFNDEQHNYDFLSVPHPELQNRRFALTPLVAIASNVIHPGLKKTIAELLKECPDQLEVKKYS